DDERVDPGIGERIRAVDNSSPELACHSPCPCGVGVCNRQRGDSLEPQQRLRVEDADPADPDQADCKPCCHGPRCAAVYSSPPTSRATVFRSLMSSIVYRPPMRPQPLCVPDAPPKGSCASQ